MTVKLIFDWDPRKAASNLRKHKVSFPEAALVFQDPLAISIPDLEHGHAEERWITLGSVHGKRLVVVVHTWRESADDDQIHIRLISAREATRHECRHYEG